MRKREDVGGDGGSERVKVESAGDAVGVLCCGVFVLSQYWLARRYSLV